MDFYKQPTKKVLKDLKSNATTGLSSQQAKTRFDSIGPNVIDIKGESWWHKLSEPFRSIFMLILAIAALTSFFLGETLDAIIIGVIIAISATIYYVQRASTERVLKSLKKYEATTVEVVRDRIAIQVAVEELVPGDIIRLYEGQKVPADARIIQADKLRCDESMLTGESNPVSKRTAAIRGDKPVYERNNTLFQGSFLVSGEATAVVTATGNSTEFGRLAALSQVTDTSSPVQDKIDKLISQIVAAVGGMAAVILLLSFYRGIALAEAFHFMLAIAVSVIPEGLPIAISVVLVMGMRRMARRKALVRSMSAIENIGLITTIASDKTGTLTKNHLEVEDVWYLDKQNKLDQLAEHFVLSANQHEGVAHDPLDGAFLEFASKYDVSTKGYNQIRSLPFDPLLPLSGNVWKYGGKHHVYIKGAPELVLANAKMSAKDRQKAEAKLHELSAQGLRVIALGYIKNRNIEEPDELKEQKLEFRGLIAVADELRPEAKSSIKAAQSAGVTVRMITGDHFETAFSIGKQLGLVKNRNQVFDCREMAKLSEKQLAEIVARTRVFSRVIPEHKFKILSILKQQEITAMTGDGVNDVPALTNAHIGLAMGSGAQIAQDAGDIVLLDNNFKSIVAALEEGRKIFDNIRRMLFLLLTTNTGEALTMLMALIVGMPLPVLPVQILWINLVTDTAMVIPLGLEPAESDIMQRKPRKPKQPILGRVVLSRMAIIASVMAVVALGLFAYFLRFTSLEYARTIAFSALVVMQWADAFNARSLWQSIFVRIKTVNRTFYVGLVAAVAMHMLAMFGPLQGVLSLVPVALSHLLITSLIAIVPIIVAGELHKLLIRRIDADFR